MKVITWNCNMAFRKKAALVLKYEPDLLIIPECEHPDKIQFPPPLQTPSSVLWFGANKNKGLGVFAFGDWTLRKRRMHNPLFRMIVPIAVTNNNSSLTLFAVWANNPDDKDGPYVEQVWKAIHHYKKYLRNKNTVLAGDFNSNTIWDRKSRAGNHSNVVQFLQKRGIESVYHRHYKQEQGREQHPTQYMYRHQDKPYHLDYCFVSNDLMGRLQSVEVGDFDFWSKYSDHVPIFSTFNPAPSTNPE